MTSLTASDLRFLSNCARLMGEIAPEGAKHLYFEARDKAMAAAKEAEASSQITNKN